MRIRTAIACLLSTTSLAVCAEPSPAPADSVVDAVFGAVDRYRNNSIDSNEFLIVQLAAMTRADTDGKLGLTLEEFRASLDAAGRQNAERSFGAFDQNGNEQLDIPEFVAYHSYVFTNVLDLDRDGAWTKEEFRSFRAANPTPASTSPAAPAPSAATTPAPDAITYLDYNGDGSVNLTEFMHAQIPKHQRFDANGDGELTEREFKASLEERARRNVETSFRTFDRNGNRGLSRAEFEAYHVYVFQRVLDRNKDGMWTREEMR